MRFLGFFAPWAQDGGSVSLLVQIDLLKGNHPRAKHFDAGAAIHSPFENLQSIDLALRLPTAPGFKDRVSDSVEILTRSSREALHAVDA